MVMCKPSSSMEHHDQHHLSGAYIRTLVKHLTTSVKSKDHSSNHEDHNIQQQSPPPPSPHRKQVRRRRRHTTKPYQERLLNMAEARREIVTALKFHRASMKQKETTANHRLPELSPSTTTNAAAVTATTTTTDLSGSYSYYWPVSTATTNVTPTVWPSFPPPENQENLDFTLPNQTLGLNLNFQDFENIDHTTMNLYHNPLSNSPTSSSSSSSLSLTSSSSTSCSSSSPSTTASSSSFSGGLHHAMDDEGMEEIRSLGEQHQMEWNDTVNLLTSARWFKFLKDIDDDKIDQVVKDIPLCMDKGEIEAMDGQWLV